jgi:hypothetical protein
MPPIKLEYSCPSCEAQTGAISQMMASDRQLVCTVNPAHKWDDTQAFLQLKPKMTFSNPKPITQQFNQVEVKLLIPPRVKDALDRRWGDKFNVTVAGVLEMVSEGDVLVVASADLDKLKMAEFLGSKPSSSPELCGMIFALRQEVTEAKNEVENARKDVAAYESHSPGRIVIDAAPFLEAAREKAKDENMPLKIWIEQKLKFALENSWF